MSLPFSESKISQETSVKHLETKAMFHAYFLFSLFLDPEDGGDMFLRNFG
jgi:hypothetical protein